MKKIFICLVLFLAFSRVNAQVTVSTIAPHPQTGLYNYFGARVEIPEILSNDVVVTGSLDAMPFTLTITAGNLYAETANNYYQCDPTHTANITLGTVTTVYAGQNVKFLANECIFNFDSVGALNAVVEALNAAYETFNANYDALYSSLDADDLDDMDDENEFDEFAPYKDFEKLFPCFVSMRSVIEETENTWLYNDFAGTDPDSIDLTYDDGENTLFNSSYAVMIQDTVYNLTPTGLYKNSVYQDYDGSSSMIRPVIKDVVFAGPFMNQPEDYFGDCKTNKKDKTPNLHLGGNKYYRLKVAIHSIGVTSSIKGKVSSYKLKNGKYKRARLEMGLRVHGVVHTTPSCNGTEYPERFDPYTYGTFKKRKSLRARVSGIGRLWRAWSHDVGVSVFFPGNWQDDFSVGGW